MNKVLSSCLFLLISFLTNGQPGTPKNPQEYFNKSDGLNPIEGIWTLEIKREVYHFDTLYDVKDISDTGQIAIIKEGEGFTAYYIKDKKMTLEYASLEFTSTDVSGVYMYQMITPGMPSKKRAVICTHGKMEYTYDLPEEEAIKYLGENYQPGTRVVNILKWKKIFPENK